jgi:alpha-tubulin suppressor-like RCC1 family protein
MRRFGDEAAGTLVGAVGVGVQVAHASAGLAHSSIVTRSGRVFTFGWGEFGQLGHNTCDDVW